MKIFKRIFKIFMILLILLFVGITIFFMTFDLNSYRGMITSKASEALGRPVSIASMSMKMSLIPTVEVKGVKIDNPSQFNQQKPFLQIDSMDVTLALIPLLSGNIELKDFNLSAANVILIDQNGQNNWTFGSKETPEKPVVNKPAASSNDNILSRLRIDNIAIKKLAISYTKDGKAQNVTLLNASIKQLKLFSLSILYDNKTIKLSGNVGDLAGFLAKKPNYTFSLTVEAFDAILKTSGTIGNTAKMENIVLNISANGKNLKNTVALTGKNIAQIPAVPFDLEGVVKGNLNGEIKIVPFSFALDGSKAKLDLNATVRGIQSDLKVLASGGLDLADKDLVAAFGIKPMQIKFNVIADTQNVIIEQLGISAGKSDVDVKGNVSLKSTVPDILAQISSSYLDAQDFVIEKTDVNSVASTPKATAKSGPLFSSEKIDLSVLKSVNANVTVAAKTIKVPEVEYVGVNSGIRLQNGVLTVSDLTVKTQAGTLLGNVTVNASQMPAQIAMKINADDLKLDTFKPVTAYVQGSQVSANMNLNTTGESVKTFVDHLNGQILLELSEGTIVDKWFNSLPVAMGMIKSKSNAMSFSASDQVSKLTCGVVNLNINNGVITSKDQIAIETSAVNFAVSGTINLPAEELSLTMVPSLAGLENNDVQRALQLTQIVKISGPFKNLKPSLDTKKTTEAAAQAGLEVLANKLAQKKGIELPIQKKQDVGYNLCEKALGRPLKGQTQNRPLPTPVASSKTTTEPTQKVEQVLPPKEEFKRQLFNSLSEALKK